MRAFALKYVTTNLPNDHGDDDIMALYFHDAAIRLASKLLDFYLGR